MDSNYNDSFMLEERTKELMCLYKLSDLLIKNYSKGPGLIMPEIAELIRKAFQYSKQAKVRIRLKERVYHTDGFSETDCSIGQDISINNKNLGRIEVFYQKTSQNSDLEFLKHEFYLLEIIAKNLAIFIEREMAVKESRKYAEQFAHILECTGEGIFGLDSNGNHTFANKTAADMLGFDIIELTGQYSHNLWHYTKIDGTPYDEQDCPIYASLRSGKRFIGEDSFRKKDGSILEVEYSCIPMFENNRVSGVVVSFKDISQRKREQETLKKHKERLALATRGTGIGIWDLDLITGYLDWDDKMFELFGLEKAKFEHDLQDFKKCLVPDDIDYLFSRFQAAIDGQDNFYVEFRIRLPDGPVRYLAGSADILRDDNNKAVRAVGINFDITARKLGEIELNQKRLELEEANLQLMNTLESVNQLALEAKAASNAKTQFLANMSHEIRTPMNGVLGFLQLLEATDLDREQSEYIKNIKSSAEALLNIINDILDLSRIELGQLNLEDKEFNVRSVIESAVISQSSNSEGKNIEISLFIDTETPDYAIGDPVRLRQVISNLVNNAIKFTHEGDVFIKAHTLSKGPDSFVLSVSIRDTGIGMSEASLDKLFSPFFQIDGSHTKKYKGTGLGLSICKRIIEAMNGDIRVESKIQEGSVFSFSVELKNCNQYASPLHNEYEVLKNRRVLIIDDNDHNRKIAESYAEEAGCIVHSMAEAPTLIYYEDNPISSYDIVLIDHKLRDADGYEIAKGIKREAEIPLVMLFASSSNIERNDEYFNAYLSKPYKKYEFLDTLVSILSKEHKPNREEKAPDYYSDLSGREIKVLLAEDNAINRILFQKILQKMNMVCDTVNNGQEALEAHIRNDYDLIFMDCQMPVMNGFDASMRIRHEKQHGKRPVIVAITAYVMKPEIDKCFECGMDYYIGKPVKPEKILNIIKKFFNNPAHSN